ncbi:hypothetical protein KEM52_002886, partial [Ascosphaera acerosa]
DCAADGSLSRRTSVSVWSAFESEHLHGRAPTALSLPPDDAEAGAGAGAAPEHALRRTHRRPARPARAFRFTFGLGGWLDRLVHAAIFGADADADAEDEDEDDDGGGEGARGGEAAHAHAQARKHGLLHAPPNPTQGTTAYCSTDCPCGAGGGGGRVDYPSDNDNDDDDDDDDDDDLQSIASLLDESTLRAALHGARPLEKPQPAGSYLSDTAWLLSAAKHALF